MKSHPPAYKHLIFADALKATGTAANVTSAVTSGIWLYKAVVSMTSGSGDLTVEPGTLLLMIGSSLVGTAANQQANVQLEHALDEYNLAAQSTPWMVAPTVVAGQESLAPGVGLTMRF